MLRAKILESSEVDIKTGDESNRKDGDKIFSSSRSFLDARATDEREIESIPF